LASDGRWYPPEHWTGPGHAGQTPTQPALSDPATQVQTPAYGAFPYPNAPRQLPDTVPARDCRTNGFAIASLVCSCVGVVLIGVPSVVGIVFGFIARARIRDSNGTQRGAGLAIAGIVVGFVVVGLVLLVIVVNATKGRT
jgi:hypothetical protein